MLGDISLFGRYSSKTNGFRGLITEGDSQISILVKNLFADVRREQ